MVFGLVEEQSDETHERAALAWLLAAVYYFYQYVLRTAPSVMKPQLSEGFALSSLGVASLVDVFHYGYSPFSLVAGSALDRGNQADQDMARSQQ